MPTLPAPLNPRHVRTAQLIKAVDGTAAASGGISTSIGTLQRALETKLGDIAVQIGKIGEGDSVSDALLDALIRGVTVEGTFVYEHWFGRLMAQAKLWSLKDIADIPGTQEEVVAEVIRRCTEAGGLAPLTEKDIVVLVRAARLMFAP